MRTAFAPVPWNGLRDTSAGICSGLLEAWVTVTVWPPAETTAERCRADVLAAAETVMVADPEPEAPEVMVSHEELLDADQGQPTGAVSAIEAVVAEADSPSGEGESE